MTHLFLTSSIEIQGIGESIRNRIGHNHALKTAFIMTPAEGDANQDDLSWVDGERSRLNANNFVTFDYTITGKKIDQIQNDLKDIDVLYVTGGNEFYFKDKCNQSGFKQFVQDFVNSGKPYISSSAGSIIVGHDMSALLNLSDTSKLPQPLDVTGLGIVDFTILPHWGSDNFKNEWLSKNSFEYMYESKSPLIALNNFEYIEVIDDQYRIIDVRNEK
jgi:dipeptidase E